MLNYEEIDINQCAGDRKLNVFSSTALCDSSTQCLPLAYFGLQQGGYECQCAGGFHYPQDFTGPYKGVELANANALTYPLCLRSERLLQFPNWISRNDVEAMVPDMGTSILQDYNIISKRSIQAHKRKTKRFIDNRNNFEKLRDSIFDDQEYLRRRCLSMPFQDIVLLNEDDERYIRNLRLVHWSFFNNLKEFI